MLLAIETLLNAPMRIGNLAALDLDRHLRFPPRGKQGAVGIALVPAEVKNEEHLDYRLKAEDARPLWIYLDRFRPLLVSRPLFRHLCAKLNQEENPGDYEGTRRLLGHKDIETTYRFYEGFETRAAFARYDERLDRRRGPGPRMVDRPGRRSSTPAGKRPIEGR